ncbi:hypothetical protein [Halosimplex sp. J119]
MTEFIAECEQCGVLERGDFEDAGDAVEDHDQFHDVEVKRVATDGGEQPWAVECQDCDFGRQFETGTVWKTPEDRAASAAGGHEGANPDHEVVARSVAIATDGGFDYVLVSRYKTRGVYHDPDPDNPDQPNCQCADLATREWQRRSVETLSDRFSYCQYCDPGETPAPKNNDGGELATQLRAMSTDEFDDQVATDGGVDQAFAGDDGPHKCDLCSQVFDDVGELEDHDCRPPDEVLLDNGGGRDA